MIFKKIEAISRYLYLMFLDFCMYVLTYFFLKKAYKSRNEIYRDLEKNQLSGYNYWLWLFLNDSGTPKNKQGIPVNCPDWFAEMKGVDKNSEKAFYLWHYRNRNYNYKNIKLVLNKMISNYIGWAKDTYYPIKVEELKIIILKTDMKNKNPFYLPYIKDNGDLTEIITGKKVMLVEYNKKWYYSFHHVYKTKKGVYKRRVFGLDMNLNKNINMFILRKYK